MDNLQRGLQGPDLGNNIFRMELIAGCHGSWLVLRKVNVLRRLSALLPAEKYAGVTLAVEIHQVNRGVTFCDMLC